MKSGVAAGDRILGTSGRPEGDMDCDLVVANIPEPANGRDIAHVKPE
jgi:hypothetical protein